MPPSQFSIRYPEKFYKGGDGEWHLYNIVKDPGETTDLRETNPAEFAAMQADYQAYEIKNQVLALPAGYDYTQQLLKNGRRIFAARWWPAVLGFVVVILALIAVSRRLLGRGD